MDLEDCENGVFERFWKKGVREVWVGVLGVGDVVGFPGRWAHYVESLGCEGDGIGSGQRDEGIVEPCFSQTLRFVFKSDLGSKSS